jgi:hypothetical protein
VHWRATGAWKTIEEQGVRQFVWDDDDPLADTFLIHYGAYPAADDIGIDYLDVLGQATLAIQCRIDKTAPIPLDVHEHPSIGFLSQNGLRRHYSVRPGWDYPGFYSGSADSLDDLVTFWNLRAADISLQFFDPAHAERYATIKPAAEERTRAQLAPLDEHRRKIAVWGGADRNRAHGIPRATLERMPGWRTILLERWSSSATDDDSRRSIVAWRLRPRSG